MKTGFLKWRPDFDVAADEYQKAGLFEKKKRITTILILVISMHLLIHFVTKFTNIFQCNQTLFAHFQRHLNVFLMSF